MHGVETKQDLEKQHAEVSSVAGARCAFSKQTDI